MIHKLYRPEILAPCGSYDILVAAVNAGADACYIGGSRFGARAYAENLDSDSVIKAIDYAHNHGVKLYLTVNTLIKNNEIKEIGGYLRPYYEAGLDAVIVQDLGVFSMVRQLFPDMHIHCSTQMNINSVHGARFMHEQGASRVVAAREMSLDEIKTIKKNTDIEIETFVHGAMCYSYSGQCLLSSVAGERSGNRGRCAQPCRKCYDGEYILSMKDMCALLLLPELFDAGIDSFKIEGRMKNAYYVASAVDAYRQMRDDCMAGAFDIDRAEALKKQLANIYNRGGFADGYFFFNKRDTSVDMISRHRPNNQGVRLGRITGVLSGKIQLELLENMYRGDVLEIRLKDKTTMDVTVGTDGERGSIVDIPAPKTKQVAVGQTVFRTRCSKILENVEREILNSEDASHKIELNGTLYVKTGKPISLTIYRNMEGRKYEVSVQGDAAARADKYGADADRLKEKISRLGGTEYYMGNLAMDVSKDAFVPMGAVKQLRRQAIAALEEKIKYSFRRKAEECGERIFNFDIPERHGGKEAAGRILTGVATIEQLEAVLGFSCVNGIYLDRSLFDTACINGIADHITERGIKLYLTLPYIIDSRFSLGKYLPNSGIHGIYIRNIDGFAAVLREGFPEQYACTCAASLYGYNNIARQYMLNLNPGLIFELPKELTLAECGGLAPGQQEFNLYGYQQVMLSAQCVRRNKNGCNRNNELVSIRDDRGNRFFCRCICNECCNVIYNGVPFDMIGKRGEVESFVNPERYNLFFTVEGAGETRRVMQRLTDSLTNKDTCLIQKENRMATTGHCYRGVE